MDAQRWLDETASSVLSGTYVDPKAGRVTFEAYYGRWSQRQVWTDGTLKAMCLAVRDTPFADGTSQDSAQPRRGLGEGHVHAGTRASDDQDEGRECPLCVPRGDARPLIVGDPTEGCDSRATEARGRYADPDA